VASENRNPVEEVPPEGKGSRTHRPLGDRAAIDFSGRAPEAADSAAGAVSKAEQSPYRGGGAAGE
jgi:hypothetical protein